VYSYVVQRVVLIRLQVELLAREAAHEIDEVGRPIDRAVERRARAELAVADVPRAPDERRKLRWRGASAVTSAAIRARARGAARPRGRRLALLSNARFTPRNRAESNARLRMRSTSACSFVVSCVVPIISVCSPLLAWVQVCRLGQNPSGLPPNRRFARVRSAIPRDEAVGDLQRIEPIRA
jgi:hypothetical protein